MENLELLKNLTNKINKKEDVKEDKVVRSQGIDSELLAYIPKKEDLKDYISRGVDERLSVHYKLNKNPITQGKQGTGKTLSHMYYAYRQQVPFLCISCYEDMILHKLFGDKTIVNGTVVFKEGLFTKMIQIPSVILFDEINAINNSKSFDFHALLQNRELFIKDADNGNGKVYKLHPDCKIGFAQNPRSSKYMGGVTKPSSFLGRCTYLTFEDFSQEELLSILSKRFPKIKKEVLTNFCTLFQSSIDYITSNSINVDISLRQIINVVELYNSGLSLKDAISDGLISIIDAVSDPSKRKGFEFVASNIFKELYQEESETEEKAEKLFNK